MKNKYKIIAIFTLVIATAALIVLLMSSPSDNTKSEDKTYNLLENCNLEELPGGSIC